MLLYNEIIKAIGKEHAKHTEVHKYVTDIYCLKQAELRRKYGSIFKGNHFTFMGNVVHAGVEALLPEYKSEVPVTIGDLHGRADLIKDDTLYELKYSSFGNNKNNEYYLLQASMYAHELGLSNVELLLLSGTAKYTVQIGKELIDKYYNKAMSIINTNEYPIMKTKCNYCEYRGIHCFR